MARRRFIAARQRRRDQRRRRYAERSARPTPVRLLAQVWAADDIERCLWHRQGQEEYLEDERYRHDNGR